MKEVISELKEALEIEKENMEVYDGREDVNSDFHNATGWSEALDYAIKLVETELRTKAFCDYYTNKWTDDEFSLIESEHLYQDGELNEKQAMKNILHNLFETGEWVLMARINKWEEK